MNARLIPLAAFGVLAASPALAQTDLRFALDWKFEGPAAPYFVALDKGYYEEEGLDVTIDAGQGSVTTIPKVASGTYDMGFGDINALIKFLDQNPDLPVQAVMMVYDAPPFAIVSTADRGVSAPEDLEGKVLGAPAPDGAYAQWPILVAENGIDESAVTIENVGFPVREPMLAQGSVDAITGFSFSSFMNLKAQGVPEDEIVVMLMSDYGLDLYGNAIFANPSFLEENPEAVAGFVRATIKGWQDTVANPEEAIDSLMKRNDIADRAVELERLQMAIRDNVLTDAVRADGLGGIDPERMGSAIDQIGIAYDYTNKPTTDAVFTAEFLPPAEQRQLGSE